MKIKCKETVKMKVTNLDGYLVDAGWSAFIEGREYEMKGMFATNERGKRHLIQENMQFFNDHFEIKQ